MAQTKPIKLGVKQISKPTDLQIRESLRSDHIEDLAHAIQQGHEIPPVHVVREGNAYWLVDGHHRVAAYEQAEANDVPAIVVKDGTRQDARWLACAANREHNALKRSNADKRRAVEAAFNANPNKSNNVIAEHVGVSLDLVNRVRSEKGSLNDSLSGTRREAADGRTMDTSNIGKKKKTAKKSTKKKAAQPRPQDNGSSGGGSPEGSGQAAEAASEGDGEPEQESDPITEMNEWADHFIAELRAIQKQMRQAFGFKSLGRGEYESAEGHAYTYSATVGQINAIVQTLDKERPVAFTADGQVQTKRGQQLSDAAK